MSSSSSFPLSWSTPTPTPTPTSTSTTLTLTSTSMTETVNGSHSFNISGYSLLEGMRIGKYVAFDTFTVSEYSWAIYFYPNNKSVEDNALYVLQFWLGK